MIPTENSEFNFLAKYILFVNGIEVPYKIDIKREGQCNIRIPFESFYGIGITNGDIEVQFRILVSHKRYTPGKYYQVFPDTKPYKLNVDSIDDRKDLVGSFEVFDITETSAKFNFNTGVDTKDFNFKLTLNGDPVDFNLKEFKNLESDKDYFYNLNITCKGYKDFNVSGNFTTDKEIVANDNLNIFVSDIKEKSARLLVGSLNKDAKYEVDFLGKITELTSNEFPFKLSSLIGNTDYIVKVREIIDGKIGKWNTANFKTVDVPKPQANILGVTFSDITSTSAKCNVSAENFDKMEIYLDGKLVSSSSPFIFRNLKYGKFYRVRVVVSNEFNSDDSISNFMTKKPDSSGGGGKPPEITGNEDLDKVVDDLDKGTMDLKTAGLIVIFTVITMIVIFFGAYWLFNMWKRWMSLSNGSDMGNALPNDSNVKLTQKMTVTSKEGKIVYTKNRKLSNSEINDTLRHFR